MSEIFTFPKIKSAISRLETERAEMVKARREPCEIQKKSAMILELRRRLARLEGKA